MKIFRFPKKQNALFILGILLVGFSLFSYQLEQETVLIEFKEPNIFRPPAFALKNDESVDSDSNIDAVANIGDDGATSYLDAQTLNTVDQVISEGQGSGYVAGTDVEDFMDAITDSQTPTDVGTYSDYTEMQDSDLIMNTLTEVDSGGGGAITIEGVYTGSCKKTQTCTLSSVTVPTSTNRAMYVFVSAYTKNTGGCAGTQEESNVDWDTAGVNEAFTNIGCDNTNKDRVSIWKLVAPTEKTADITISHTTSNNWNWGGAVYGVYVLSGVHQTTPDDGFNGNSGNSGASTVSVSSATGDLVLDVVATSTALTVDGSQTEKWNFQSPSTVFGGSSTEAGTTTVSMDWTFTSATWGAAGISINPSGGGTNYRFDREFSFTTLDFNDANEELAMRTGTIGTESLQIYVWDSAAWVLLTTIVDANDNVWINISISSYLDSATEYFSFRDATVSSDTTLNTWEFDSVLIHSWNDDTNDYELQWEHQATSLPAYSTDNAYSLTIYGFISVGGSETISAEVWNSSSSSWITVTSFSMSTTEQWYNQTFSCGTVGVCGTTMTWRFLDSITSADGTQNTLNIDYSGLYIYSLTMTLTEATGSVTIQPDSSDYALSENPFNLVIDAGENFDIQIRGIDVTGTPVGSNWMWFDTDSSPAGYTQLTSSYQTLYSNQAFSTTALQFWMWGNIPPPEQTAGYSFTLEVRIIKTP